MAGTASVTLSERLGRMHQEAGQIYATAPVFGRPEAAAAAKLFIVAAGPTEAIEKCQPLFGAMGQKTFVIGEKPSDANLVKLSGNFLIAATIESLGEAIALARKSGIDAHFRYVADLLTAINRFLEEYNQQSKPFAWTADPNKIIAAVKRGHQVLDSIH